MRARSYKNNPYIIKVTLVSIIVTLFYFLMSISPAHGSSFSWMSGGIDTKVIDPQPSEEDCSNQQVIIGSIASTTPRTVCVYQGNGFKYGLTHWGTTRFVIGIGSDSKMYIVNDGPTGVLLKNPDSDHLVWKTNSTSSGWRLWWISNIKDKLVKKYNSSMLVEYDLKPGSSDFLIKDDNGNDAVGRGANFSRNGKWIAAEFSGRGVVLLSMETGTIKWISNRHHAYGIGADPGYSYGVIDDGKYVVVGGGNVTPEIIEVNEQCGLEAQTVPSAWLTGAGSYLTNPCPMRDIRPILQLEFQGSLKSIGSSRFSNDGGELTVYALSSLQGESAKWIKMTANGYTPSERLEYLALGDSYSSGEGDTAKDSNGNKFYRAYTKNEGASGTPREKCHLSTRSYPYILAQSMNLSMEDPSQWNSVACSGAERDDIIGLGTYLGQDKGGKDGATPRLEGFSDVDGLKTTALNEFIPGRERQIEFVKKYQPKVITLTMGGNDIGFADKIYPCLYPGTTCSTATQHTKPKLMGQILSQFDDLRTLYTELTSASDPRAKIYVIGYPKFVGDNNLLCLPNAGGLSNTELSMINGSVEYFNNVIEAAAIASGVKYVDIENSLAGHKLCETGNHVTGITGLGGWRGNERQESFHPNAAGHSRIASTIQSMLGANDLRSYHNPNCSIVVNTCPDSSVDAVDIVESSYFSGINPNENVQYAKMSFGDIIKGIATRFATGSNYFAPGSTINVTLYSDPTDLGDYSADGAGAFDETITIPSNVPTGYHTLTVSGETHSGEPIEYEQIIFVKNSSADTDNQLLYRVRNGDPNKQHNGAAEEANYLYIERNNYVAISSGLASDYDADGDGWSIVGASSGITYGSTSVPDISPYANFVIDEEDNMPMPYLYIRAGDHGCVKYKPTSLDEVEQGQVRTLTLVDTHTSSCRAQPGSDDLDFDGIADNVQPIYTARNGMSYLWEDPSKIYLFRSFHATEAQLGISDMNIGGTPFANPQAPLERFNKLAVSSGYIGNYNKLIILQDSEGAPLPTVLTKHYSTNECAAYHPTSTAMITYQDFQSPRSFIKLENLPEGEDCE